MLFEEKSCHSAELGTKWMGSHYLWESIVAIHSCSLTWEWFPPGWSPGLPRCLSTGSSWWCSWTGWPAPWPGCLSRRSVWVWWFLWWWWCWSGLNQLGCCWCWCHPELMTLTTNPLWIRRQWSLRRRRTTPPTARPVAGETRFTSQAWPPMLYLPHRWHDHDQPNFTHHYLFYQYIFFVAVALSQAGHREYFYRTERSLAFSHSYIYIFQVWQSICSGNGTASPGAAAAAARAAAETWAAAAWIPAPAHAVATTASAASFPPGAYFTSFNLATRNVWSNTCCQNVKYIFPFLATDLPSHERPPSARYGDKQHEHESSDWKVSPPHLKSL